MRDRPARDVRRRRTRNAWAVAALGVSTIFASCGAPSPSSLAILNPSPITTTVAGTPTPRPTRTSAPPSALPATPAPTPERTLQPGPDRWVAAGSMRAAQNVEAVELADGRVLAIGWDENGVRMIAELWDPATNKWRRTRGLNKNRYQFDLVALEDGRALVAGGINDVSQSFSSAYVLDPAAERWTKVGLMDNARTGAATTLMSDGRVLVAGGNYCTGFDGVAGVMLAAYPVRPAPVGLPGQVLADTGPIARCRALATAEVFDPRTDTWSPTGPMRHPRTAAVGAPLGDGRVLVWEVPPMDGAFRDAGGEIYDPASGRFTSAPRLPELDRAFFERVGVAIPEDWQGPASDDWATESVKLVPLPDGDALLIVSGWLSGSGDEPWEELHITRWLRFDTAATAWLEIGEPFLDLRDLNDSRTTYGRSHPNGISVALHDGRVLFAGGRAAEVLDPTSGAWSSLPRLPARRWVENAVRLVDGSVFVIATALGKPDTRAFRFMPAR